MFLETRRVRVGMWLRALLCMAVCGGVARAAGNGDGVVLQGTTVPGHAAHAAGAMDVTVPGTMVFRSAGKPDLVMPYAEMFEFGLKREDAFHLGFFPAMFYGMVAPRPQRHVFTVSWHDAEGTGQEATFEISKPMSEHLMPVMYARARKACVRTEYGACAPVVPPPPPVRIPLTGPGAASAASTIAAPAETSPAAAAKPATP